MSEKCKWFDLCPMRNLERDGEINDSWKDKYCKKNYVNCKRFQMEENGIVHADNMLPDGTCI